MWLFSPLDTHGISQIFGREKKVKTIAARKEDYKKRLTKYNLKKITVKKVQYIAVHIMLSHKCLWLYVYITDKNPK